MADAITKIAPFARARVDGIDFDHIVMDVLVLEPMSVAISLCYARFDDGWGKMTMVGGDPAGGFTAIFPSGDESPSRQQVFGRIFNDMLVMWETGEQVESYSVELRREAASRRNRAWSTFTGKSIEEMPPPKLT